MLDAVRISGQRAIVSKGWGQLGGDADSDIPSNAFLIGSCPHDWLFQRVSCVVHHGGAGTTATGLALGRPTVVVSFFGDQLFWGSIVARAGAGPRPIPYRELSADKLAAAIGTALDGATQRRAAEIGDQMQREDGVQNAVNSFHRHLDLDRLRCAVVPSKPAVWRVKHSETALSTVAAAVLVDTGRLKPQHLVLYMPLPQVPSRADNKQVPPRRIRLRPRPPRPALRRRRSPGRRHRQLHHRLRRPPARDAAGLHHNLHHGAPPAV